MGINTGTLTLGSSMPAKTPFSAPATGTPASNASNDPNTDPSQNAATGSATAAGSGQTGSTPGTDGSTASGQKSTGPSAQTRNAPPSQTRGSSRAARMRANAANPASGPPGTDPQDATQQTRGGFGSAMATALSRSASSSTDAPVPVRSATVNTDAPTAPAPAQPAASAATDAVAWFAQALMPPPPPAPAQAVAVTADSAHPADRGSATIGSATQGNTASAGGLPSGTLAAQLAAHSAIAPAQAGGSAADFQAVAPPASQAQAGQTNPAAMAAAASPAANVNALADVQKLISGLTAANSTVTDGDTDAAAPKTHAAAESGDTDAAQAAAALQTAALTRPTSTLGGATLTIHAPVGSAAFAEEVSARAGNLAQSGITQAQLQLNPADLGPVQVHITMQAGQASVWFGATHADTRAALEQSLPRLRELFAGAGMPLTDSGVFREPPQQQQAQAQPLSGNSRATLSDTVVAPTVTQVANIRLALLDTYA